MCSNTIDVRSIASLSGMNFYIPDYQRGYRWTASQAIQMLSDFEEFCKRNDQGNVASGEYYCLQPIVVKKKEWTERKGDGREEYIEGYEVIDGQQRLTTLYIIMKCIWKVCEILYPKFQLYSINYETRKEYDSNKFLTEIDQNTGKANEFIDFYYMKSVYDAVYQWIDSKAELRNEIARILLEHKFDAEENIDLARNVRVIWYEVSGDNTSSSIDIFTRLNIGKIPLTNAELIKALLLKKGNFLSSDDTMRQLQIATEWNSIEQRLQDDSFWYFLYRSDYPFTYENRIEFIFDLMKSRTIDSEFYHTFNEFNKELESLKSEKKSEKNQRFKNQECINKIWDNVKQIYQTFVEWYEDRTLYHLIGFLIEYKADIRTLINASKSKKKDEFLNYIKKEISNKLGRLSIDDLSFAENKYSIKQVLLLFNILTALKDKKSDMRFPFNKYKMEKWDIEHVCSQTDKTITNENQQRRWIDDMLEFFVGSSAEDKVNQHISNLEIEIKNNPEQARNGLLRSELKLVNSINSLRKEGLSNFENVFKEVQSFFNEDKVEDKDNISNLTLLDEETNRSYGNAFFPIKRKRIIANDELGIFVPIATKNLFLKYYSKRSNNLMHWENSDAKDYLACLKEFVSPYIKA